jgi:RNA recognition motif-containing protein
MTNIYVGNLSFAASEQDLRSAFEKFGSVQSASVITDRFSGRSKGFGFVEMTDDLAAQTAIATLNETSLAGRNIKVNVARPRIEPTPR